MPWLPVYTRAERNPSRMPSSLCSSALSSAVAVLGLVLALAPSPSSLALQVDVGHPHHAHHHHHPVDMEQWSVRAPGDVRCYCNLAECVASGYMCKSAGKGCFSDLRDHVDVYRATHGCLDLLDDDRQRQCKNQPRPDLEAADDAEDDVHPWELDASAGAPPQEEPAPPRPMPSLLLCCTEDMCNHIDSPDSRMRTGAGSNGSEAAHAAVSGPAAVAGVPGVPVQPGLAAGSSEAAAAAAAARSAEMWFKAATIAVPICGALILVLLIVLAVRLLRADGQHHRASKLSACAFPSDKKAPLLPGGTGVGWGHGLGLSHGQGVNRLDCPLPAPTPPKNHTLAKLNYSSASYDLLDLHKEDNLGLCLPPPQPHVHRNINSQRNVLLAPSGTPSAKSSYKQVLASFVPWGGGGGGTSSHGAPTNV